MIPEVITAMGELKNYKYARDSTGPGPADIHQEFPLNYLVLTICEYDVKALQYLLYHVAARSLPRWESYCESRYPRNTINTIKQFLEGKIEAWVLNGFIDAEQPSVNDCRYCDAMAASEAIANAAAFMLDDEPLTATSSIRSAECAFDNVGMSDGFRRWFFDIAIPISFEKRFMTEEELGAYTTFKFALDIYHSLYVPGGEKNISEEVIPVEVDNNFRTTVESKSWWKFW